MESNFIKERVVVREGLIRKNASATRDQNQENHSEKIQISPERVTILEELINEDLKQDLIEISKQVEIVCQTIADYCKVRSALKVFKNKPRDVRLLSNIGCNFYAHCYVEDASKIFLSVGKDYFLHMEIEEAFKMIDLKEQQWMKELDRLQEKASSIKAYIKIALEAIGTVYEKG